MKFTYLATTVALLAIGAVSQAATIANWTFEVNTPGDLTDTPSITGIAADFGAGTASGVHAGAATDWTTPAGNGSANSLSSNTWAIGDYYQFQFSLTGFSGATFSFDQNRSGTGPSDFKIAVSTNGTSFTDLGTYVVASQTWNAGAGVNSAFGPQSLGVATDNAANVWVRLIATSAPTGATPANGTNRVDNILVDAQAVPEPATMAIIGLAAAAVARRKRK